MSVSSNLLKENSRDLLREDEPCDDEIESPIDDDEEFWKTSIRVVLVDSDPTSLYLTMNLMTQFSYQVTVFKSGDEAIAFLKKSKHEIDLVIWDFHVPEINGLEALNTIGKEMDLPVVIMSHDHKKETVMQSTKYGACNFLVKPLSNEVTAVLWQHVYRKRMSKSNLDSVESNLEEDGGLGQDDNDLYQSNEEGSKNVDDSGEQNTSYQKGHNNKKQRMTWTPELHQKFEKAIEKIGSADKAVPKLILKIMQEDMNVEGLSRNNVASHLQRLRWQKFRQNAEKKSCVPQETREDSCWPNAGPNTALTASKSLLNSSFGLHTRVPYFTNDQAAANTPMQYPSNNYLTMKNSHFMTNPLANLPYTDSFHQPQEQQYQHQQYYRSSLQLPSVLTKQESPYVSAAMEIPDLITDQNSPFFDHGEYFPAGLSNFDPISRY